MSQQDVYQLIAYARIYRCDRLMLLYSAAPGEPGGLLRSFGLAWGVERLDVATLAVAAGPDAVTRQLGDLLARTLPH